MRSGLTRFALGVALLLMSPQVRAADSGKVGVDDDGAAPLPPQDAAALFDEALIACDGALCETQTGTTCDVAAASPGRISPSAASPFAILAVLALIARRRWPARLSIIARGSGRDAHLDAAGWATGPRPA